MLKKKSSQKVYTFFSTYQQCNLKKNPLTIIFFRQFLQIQENMQRFIDQFTKCWLMQKGLPGYLQIDIDDYSDSKPYSLCSEMSFTPDKDWSLILTLIFVLVFWNINTFTDVDPQIFSIRWESIEPLLLCGKCNQGISKSPRGRQIKRLRR